MLEGCEKGAKSYCSPSHLHPALAAPQQLPEADLSLASVPLCVASVPCPWPRRLSPWQQLAAAIGYAIWILCSTQTRHRFICKNQAGIFWHQHQLWVGFQKKRFFPPACYKTILNGGCNPSTLNKWGSFILKLISHHQPLPNNNNFIADGPVFHC